MKRQIITHNKFKTYI